MKVITTVLLSLFAVGADAADRPERRVDPAALSATFMHAHPDIDHRLQGQRAWEDGEFTAAAREFRRAAEWGDKPSQAMLARMLWDGQGVSRDRVEAYVWADLAAERGYTPLLVQREQFWAALSADERTRALDIGPDFYDRYGDDVVQPRLARRIERDAPRRVTGSNLGFVGMLTVVRPDLCSGAMTPKLSVHGVAGCDSVTGDAYFDRRVWKPAQYFVWQDRVADEVARGVVAVGEITNGD